MKYWRWYVRLFILLSMGAALLYACFVEREWTEVTHHRLNLPEWQGRVARLAVLSDLHVRPEDEDYLRRIVVRTLAEKPDAVLLLGDYVNEVNSTLSLDKLEEILRPLTAVPCFAVLGNHDYWYGARKLRKMFKELNIPLMEGKKQELVIGGAPITIAGMRCAFTYRYPGAVSQPETGKPFILMTHSPAGVKFAPSGTTITLTGHTHGGQIRMPFYGALVMPDRDVDRKKSAGYHEEKGKGFYVTRGLGTSQVPLRFCCRPEILILELAGFSALSEETR